MTADAAEQAEGQTGFFSLPPELRQMVYDLAYGSEEAIKVKLRCVWQWMEDHRYKEEREDFVVR